MRIHPSTIQNLCRTQSLTPEQQRPLTGGTPQQDHSCWRIVKLKEETPTDSLGGNFYVQFDLKVQFCVSAVCVVSDPEAVKTEEKPRRMGNGTFRS